MQSSLLKLMVIITLQTQFFPSIIAVAENINAKGIDIVTGEGLEEDKNIEISNNNDLKENLVTQSSVNDNDDESAKSSSSNAQITEESISETNLSEEIDNNSGNIDPRNPEVGIQVIGSALTATLKNNPDARTVVSTIADVISSNRTINTVIINGSFGADNAGGYGRSLAEGNVNHIHFQNSNYIPMQFYSSDESLYSVTDDGSIKQMSSRSIRVRGSGKTEITRIELNSLERIDGYNLVGFNGQRLSFPALKIISAKNNYAVSEMAFIEEIDFSKLEVLDGYQLFRDMPSLKSADLGSLVEINTESQSSFNNFFDLKNQFPVYVNLISLKGFPEIPIGSSVIDGLAPIYMKVRNDFSSDLAGTDRNVLAYSGINDHQEIVRVGQDDKLKLSAFGDNFYTFGDNISVNWYINGTRSAYTGAEIEIAASEVGVGTFTFSPVIDHNGVEEPEFLRDVEIEVEVRANKVTAEAVPQEVVLGGEFTKEQLQSFVKKVKFGEYILKPEEYVVEQVSLPSTSLVGEKVAEVKVIHQASGTEAVIEVPVTVLWGNTIYAVEANASASTAALSLLVTENGPALVASEGYGTPLSSENIRSRPSFSIFSNNYNNKIGSLHYGTVHQGRSTLVAGWNQDLMPIDIKYGDVLSLSVFQYAIAAQNYNGNNTWVTRNEIPVLEAVGFPEALYMMTKEGYQLMRVNQLITNDLTFSVGSTTKEIEERLSEFFDFHSDFTENEKEEFSYKLICHDGTLKTGEKKAQIQVTQTKGEYHFSYEYEVSFYVEPGTIELNELANADFDFGEIKYMSNRQEVQAKGDLAPRIIINDYSNVSQWDLLVSRTPYADEQGRVLNDVTMAFKNLKIFETVHEELEIPSGDVIVDQTPYSIGTMVNKEGIHGKEYGKSVIQIGDSQNSVLTGVSLKLPANIPIDASTYRTTVTWELVSDPTLLGGGQ
ncbi:WxL domain-containing protein [Enterococcus mundtii]|uniref:WxL domain-containing protein n=1 Tax=Enterococcus mundtii TaxID=53346 RepID=A0A242KFI5_ENTMU|nr:WxL domain-containing protein [Enterococcus mundtii]OTP19934.1 hypothetical protein A5802_003338 [Enterococcus mundtii]